MIPTAFNSIPCLKRSGDSSANLSSFQTDHLVYSAAGSWGTSLDSE